LQAIVAEFSSISRPLQVITGGERSISRALQSSFNPFE
jgi:hypothetical protein